ncbi:MAG: hypothetical protein AAFQ84_05395 [Pseudomonadota bacterium]
MSVRLARLGNGEMDVTEALAWARDHGELIAAIGAAVVSVIGAVLAARETAKQRRLQMEALRADADRQCLEWGHEAIDAMSDASALAVDRDAILNEREFKLRRAAIAARLSALADRGRLFFPNFDPDKKGGHKEEAFRGNRPPILYALIYAFYEVEALKEQGARGGGESADFLYRLRRLLVSELQSYLDPRRRNEVVERYDHLSENVREDAVLKTARLGVELDARRPGTLARYNDTGLVLQISPEERRQIMHNIQNERPA